MQIRFTFSLLALTRIIKGQEKYIKKKRKKENEDHTPVLMILLLAKNLAIGGVSASVIGTRMGNKALLQSTAIARAPPEEATSSAVRFLFFSATTAVD